MKRDYLAVLLGGLAMWLLGAGWFTVFAKPWIAGTRLTDAEVAYMTAHPSPVPYVVTLICDVIMAAALLWVMRRTGEVSISGGVKVGAVLGVGVAAAALLTELVFEARPMPFVLVAVLYPVVAMVLMGVVVAALAGKERMPVKRSVSAM